MVMGRRVVGGIVAATVVASLCVCSLGGCTKSKSSKELLVPNVAAPPVTSSAATVSPAAAALSVQSSALEANESAYMRAVRCTAASVVVLEQVRRVPAVGDAQVEALRSAQRLFEKRALELASGEEKSRNESLDDIRGAVQAAQQDPAEQSKTMLGCVRSLETPS